MRPSTSRSGFSAAATIVVALVLAACGGRDGSIASVAAPNFDGAIRVVPATAPPAPVAADVVPTADAGFQRASEASGEHPQNSEDPWRVTVLTANEDVNVIPTFDAPNGNAITIYDVNQIDGVQLEYPLYAQTYFGNRLALVVERFDSTGAWAEVGLPVRPNGSTAWVQTAFFTQMTHNYHITIDLSENSVNVYKGDDLIVEQIAVSGRESRPTPVVRAYIDEKISGPSLGPAYGTWILSIAAFSEALGTFGGGGMPKLALHGTNQPELMGQYVSSGCVRVPNEIIDLIAETVPVGTIVDIVA